MTPQDGAQKVHSSSNQKLQTEAAAAKAALLPFISFSEASLSKPHLFLIAFHGLSASLFTSLRRPISRHNNGKLIWLHSPR